MRRHLQSLLGVSPAADELPKGVLPRDALSLGYGLEDSHLALVVLPQSNDQLGNLSVLSFEVSVVMTCEPTASSADAGPLVG